MQLLLKWRLVRIPTIVRGKEVLHLQGMPLDLYLCLHPHHLVDLLSMPLDLQTLLQDLGINGGGLKRTVFHHLRQKYLQMLLLIGLPSSSRTLPPWGGSCTSGILQLITGSTFT